MNKVKKIVYGALASVMVLSLVSCDMIEKTPEAKAKEVIGKVNNVKITRGDIDGYLSTLGFYYQLEQQYGEDYLNNSQLKDTIKQSQETALENLVTKEIVIQKGQELGLFDNEEAKTKIEKAITDEVDNLKSAIEANGNNYEEYLEKLGITEEDIKKSAEEKVKMDIVQEDMSKDATVSADDISSYYNENKDNLKVEAGKSIYHILVDDEAEAKDIIKQLNNGADFSKLAKEKSKDETSAVQGGFLQDNYNAESSQYVTEFNEGIKAIENGGVSQTPVKSQYGYHIIKVVIQPETRNLTLEEATPRIEGTLLQQKKSEKIMSTYSEWESAAKIEKNTDKL